MATIIEAKTRKKALEQADGAEIVVKVCGGYMAFDSIEEYEVWKNQK